MHFLLSLSLQLTWRNSSFLTEKEQFITILKHVMSKQHMVLREHVTHGIYYSRGEKSNFEEQILLKNEEE